MQLGPAARTDARHKVTVSAVIQAPWGITVSPVFRYRSALPMHIWYGYDNNVDGVSNDLYPTAYRFKDVDDAGMPTFEEIGRVRDRQLRPRRAALAVEPARGEEHRDPRHGMRVELFGEVFNLFNAINPAFNAGAVRRRARRSYRHAGEPHAEHGRS